MIKVNVILDNINWRKYITNPKIFIDNRIKLLNKKNNLFKKKKLIFSLALSDTTKIKRLNRLYRKKNLSTDVLSFPFYEKNILTKKIKKEKEIYIGDVIVNLNKIKNKNNKRLFLSEFNKLWIHGLVHLFGHQHKRDKDFYKMDKLEKKYIKSIS